MLAAIILAAPFIVARSDSSIPQRLAPSQIKTVADSVDSCALAFSDQTFGNPEVPGNISANAEPDVIVDVNHNGALQINYGDIGVQVVTAADFPTVLSPDGNTGANFGSATTTMDVDRDGCSDLIVGSPAPSDVVNGGIGRVAVLYGSSTGLFASGVKILSSSIKDDDFGAAVASSNRFTSTSLVGDLWVGAPNRTVNGLAEAGAVDHYVFSETGVLTFLETITAASAHVNGVIHAGAHFGSVLAGGANGLVIGAPDDTVNGFAGAGSITIINEDKDTGLVTSGAYWTQDSPGVPGTAEAGDHFGAAISAYGGDDQTSAIVGVPGEDVGSLADAGSVQFFQDGKPGEAITQDSTGIPGTAEAGDDFGAAVTSGFSFFCQEEPDVAIGSPGEDVGSVVDAGTVTLMANPSVTSPCTKPVALTGGSSGFGYSVQKNARAGAALNIRHGNPDDEDSYVDQLLIGIPGQNVNGFTQGGAVVMHVTRGSKNLNTDYTYAVSSTSGGPNYGAFITSPAGGFVN